MARLRVTRLRIVAAAVLAACLAATLFVAFGRVAPAHANGASASTPLGATCASYVQYDDIVPVPVLGYVSNPHRDDTHPSPSKPEIWDVYYNLRRDAATGRLCAMQLVLRITPPSGGEFWGPVRYRLNTGEDHDLYNPEDPPIVVPGSDTTQTVYAAAPNHVVTRSAWFGISPDTYTLESWNVNFQDAEEATVVFDVDVVG